MPIWRAYRRYRWVMVSGFHGMRPAGSGENVVQASSGTATPSWFASVRRRWNRSRNSSQVSRSSDSRRPSPVLGGFSMRVPCLTRRAQAVEGVGPELTDLHVPQHRSDGAADITPVRLLVDSSRSVTSRYLSRAWPSVAARLGNRAPSASFSSRPSAAASSGQVSRRRRGLPVTGSVPAQTCTRNEPLGSGSMWPRTGVGHGGTITRAGVIRSTTRSTESNVPCSINASELEPPIGIEPMTYALRGGREPSSGVHVAPVGLVVWALVPSLSRLIQGRC